MTKKKSNVIQQSHINEKHGSDSVDPKLIAAFTGLVGYLKRDGDMSNADIANMHDTPVRAAKAFRDLVRTKTEIRAELLEIAKTGFPSDISDRAFKAGIVTQGPIEFWSYCPHHLLPVEYEAYVSYLPSSGKDSLVLGLSKLARIAQTLGKRPVLQEQLASDIANVLCSPKASEKFFFPSIKTRGSAVLLVGKHLCMCCRGVKSDARTQVCEVRGIFAEDSMESRFYQAVSMLRK